MRTIVDAKGRSWDIIVDVPNIARLRETLKINLLELVIPHNTLVESLNDPCKLVDLLFVLCRDQADEREVTDLEFGRSMTPDCIEDGLQSVLEGVVNFSPRGVRPAYQKVLEKATKFQAAQADKVLAMVTSPEFDTMLEKELEKLSKTPTTSPSESTGDAGSLQELSASNPEGAQLSPP